MKQFRSMRQGVMDRRITPLVILTKNTCKHFFKHLRNFIVPNKTREYHCHLARWKYDSCKNQKQIDFSLIAQLEQHSYLNQISKNGFLTRFELYAIELEIDLQCYKTLNLLPEILMSPTTAPSKGPSCNSPWWNFCLGNVRHMTMLNGINNMYMHRENFKI